jgi:hypothetical protein
MSVLDLLKPAPQLSQTARILKLLKSKHQVTNRDLNRIAFRYSARIADLRVEGWNILSIREKDGLWRFVLQGHRDDK